MTQQYSVFQGLMSWTTSHMRNMRASIWVVESRVEQVNESKAMRDTDLNRVRSVEGVDFAVPCSRESSRPGLPTVPTK